MKVRRKFVVAAVVLLVLAAAAAAMLAYRQAGAIRLSGSISEAAYPSAGPGSEGRSTIKGNLSDVFDPGVIPDPAGSFQISGDVPELFYPGVSHTLDLVLANPENTYITVTSLTITVDPVTSNAGCDGTENLQVNRQFIGTATVPAGSTQSLSGLGVDESAWPLLTMPDLPVSQDACQGATITLHYTGEAVSGEATPGPGALFGGMPLTGFSMALAAAAVGMLGMGTFLYRKRAEGGRSGKAGRR